MKRSEALKLLEKLFQQNIDTYGVESIEDLAKETLDILESNGMLPPAIYIKSFDKYDNTWDSEDNED